MNQLEGLSQLVFHSHNCHDRCDFLVSIYQLLWSIDLDCTSYKVQNFEGSAVCRNFLGDSLEVGLDVSMKLHVSGIEQLLKREEEFTTVLQTILVKAESCAHFLSLWF